VVVTSEQICSRLSKAGQLLFAWQNDLLFAWQNDLAK
jgi:hypothetical protein